MRWGLLQLSGTSGAERVVAQVGGNLCKFSLPVRNADHCGRPLMQEQEGKDFNGWAGGRRVW